MFSDMHKALVPELDTWCQHSGRIAVKTVRVGHTYGKSQLKIYCLYCTKEETVSSAVNCSTSGTRIALANPLDRFLLPYVLPTREDTVKFEHHG
jgi:hypothetical protein